MTGGSLVWLPCTRPQAPQDPVSRDKRRRAAEYRSVPLACGCRDPRLCRCTEPPLTVRAVDGWAAAARYLLDQGKTPMVPIEVLRALWQRGGEDRTLAKHLHGLVGGEAA